MCVYIYKYWLIHIHGDFSSQWCNILKMSCLVDAKILTKNWNNASTAQSGILHPCNPNKTNVCWHCSNGSKTCKKTSGIWMLDRSWLCVSLWIVTFEKTMEFGTQTNILKKQLYGGVTMAWCSRVFTGERIHSDDLRSFSQTEKISYQISKL